MNPKLEEKYKLRVNKELGWRNKQGGREIEPVGQLKEALKMRLINENYTLMLDDTWKTGCLNAVVRLNSSLL